MSKRKAKEKPAEIVINDDFSYVSPKDGKTYTMTMKEKLFSEAYLEYSGNGVDAVYSAGYMPRNSLVAASIAYENLRKPHIIAYVNSMLEERGFNDDNVEKQHMFLLQQHSDLKTKAKAVELFYKLRGKLSGDGDKPRVVNTYNLFYQPLFQAQVKVFETGVKDIIAHENVSTSQTPVAA